MNRTARENRRAASAAFTLVEVLVASTVFLLLIVLFTQLVVNISQTAVRSNSEMDSLGDARQTLDTFAQDWNARVRRSDVSMQATTNTINFLSQVRGYSGTRQLATVSYQMDLNQTDPVTGLANPNFYKLVRGIVGYNWLSTDPAATPSGGSTPAMLVFPADTATATTTGSPSPTPLPSPGATPVTPVTGDYEAASDHVFHMAVSSLTATGFSMASTLAVPPKLQGVVLTLAVLDPKYRKLVTATQFAAMGAALDTGSGGTLPTDIKNAVSPLTVWQQNLNAADFAKNAGVPPTVAAAVRIYQRVFYLQE